MAVSEEEVRHVAKLAKLELEADEITTFTKRMGELLDLADQLSTVDTTGIPVTTHGYPLKNVMRPDVPEPGTDRELLFKNVKAEIKDGMIRVPAILDNEVEGA